MMAQKSDDKNNQGGIMQLSPQTVNNNFYCFYDSAYTLPVFGLNNTGSICWFNSILQMLFSLPAFNMCMIESESAGCFDENPEFAVIYCRIIKEIGKYNPAMKSFISSDLINAFSKDLEKRKKRAINGQEGAANGFIEIIQVINSKYIYDCLNNKYRRIINCEHCGQRVSSVDELSPMINIYRQTDFANEDDFQKFIKYHVSKVDKYVCDNKKCGKVMRDFNRLEQLTMLREVIIFSFNTGMKRWYPGKMSIISAGMKMLRYILVAQIEHSGSYNKITHQSSGHYWAKVFRNGEWYQTNDSQVTKVEQSGLIDCGGHKYPAPSSSVHMIAYHLVSEDDFTEQEKEKYAEEIKEIAGKSAK